jgi:hypothetical protein
MCGNTLSVAVLGYKKEIMSGMLLHTAQLLPLPSHSEERGLNCTPRHHKQLTYYCKSKMQTFHADTSPLRAASAKGLAACQYHFPSGPSFVPFSAVPFIQASQDRSRAKGEVSMILQGRRQRRPWC